MLEHESTSTSPSSPGNDRSNFSPRRRRAAGRPAGPPSVASSTPSAVSTGAQASDRENVLTDKPNSQTQQPPTPQRDEPAGSGSPTGPASVPLVTFQAPSLVSWAPAPTRNATTHEAAPAPADATGGPDDTNTAPVNEDKPLTSRRRRGGRGRRGRHRKDNILAAVAEQVSDDSDQQHNRASGRDQNGRQETPSKEQDSTTSDSTEPVSADQATTATGAPDHDGEDPADQGARTTRRRRRRRRRDIPEGAAEPSLDDPPDTVVKVREPRKPTASTQNEVQTVEGSTRLEAKKQRRREGWELGRRRPPVVSEAEFLARREAVQRIMVLRQTTGRIQIAVLEDGILVEHYVSSDSTTSLVGNVYLGKVQSVLPSMEAAFVDIGKGRNAVLYAGEVNFDLVGLEGRPKRIESVLKSGQSVLVQVTKDPMGHKGARLTSQVSLAGRYLVYLPDGSMTGISRKLPDVERERLKETLKTVVSPEAGVIVRTAAEGASEQELSRDVARLVAQWEDIQGKAKSGIAPALLYAEPELPIRVVRDNFNGDFSSLVVSGDDAWETLEPYLGHVAPDLLPRLSQWTAERDVFAEYRIDEQLAKALDHKVWLPSGGSLVIDRTEAMIVVDVNTGKFTGQGGNLEETVTKTNVEAAEEIVRQLRLRDLGGIIVIDFIDMVLGSNRELVLRRLLECLGRDRTKHQVAEMSSLGLVQMTRKRISQGLLEAFSQPCVHCDGRGVHISMDAVESSSSSEKPGRQSARRSSRRNTDQNGSKSGQTPSDKAMTSESATVTPEAVDGSGSSSLPVSVSSS